MAETYFRVVICFFFENSLDRYSQKSQRIHSKKGPWRIVPQVSASVASINDFHLLFRQMRQLVLYEMRKRKFGNISFLYKNRFAMHVIHLFSNCTLYNVHLLHFALCMDNVAR